MMAMGVVTWGTRRREGRRQQTHTYSTLQSFSVASRLAPDQLPRRSRRADTYRFNPPFLASCPSEGENTRALALCSFGKEAIVAHAVRSRFPSCIYKQDLIKKKCRGAVEVFVRIPGFP
jgi:hypothetical protein